MLSLAACEGRPEAGQKALRLGRALRLGLPVPDGVVLLPGEPLDPAALSAALLGLGGGPFAVRSSAEAEDRPGRSAAGLFLSLLRVPADAVAVAAAQVRASGAAPVVRAYLGAEVKVAVLIQPQLDAAVLGVLHLPASGPALAEERAPEEPEWGESAPRTLDEGADAELLAAARRLAALIGAEGAADPTAPRGEAASAAVQIEYARLRDGALRILQVRPAPPAGRAAEPWPAPDAVLGYALDRAHNPDPLAAQASLVDLVEEIGAPLGLAQRVVRGYLYAARSGPSPAGLPPAEIGRLRDEAFAACDARLAPLEAEPAPALADVLAAYHEVYRRYLGEIGPTLRRARGALDGLLLSHLGTGLAAHGALLAGVESATGRRLQALWQLGRAAPGPARDDLLAAYLHLYGATAPAWDVAVPCDEEAPARVLAQAAALAAGPAPEERRRAAEAHHLEALGAVQERLPPPARAMLTALLPPARAAAALGEDDDALFFRAQRLVRRALRARGAALQAAGLLDDEAQVFALPLGAAPGAAPADLRARARAAAAEQAAQRRLVPPERFEAGRPIWPLPGGPVLRGRGVAAADAAPVRGTARVFTALDLPPPREALRGKVLVLPALLPSWAPQLLAAAALVTDSGGALSHGATLAREAGVPAVVGTRTATRELRDGDEVLVDAARGLVVRAQGAAPAP